MPTPNPRMTSSYDEGELQNHQELISKSLFFNAFLSNQSIHGVKHFLVRSA